MLLKMFRKVGCHAEALHQGRARQCRHCLRPYPPPHDCFCWRRPRLLAGWFCKEQAADRNGCRRSWSGDSNECQHRSAAHRARRGSVQGKRDPWRICVGCHGRRKGGRNRKGHGEDYRDEPDASPADGCGSPVGRARATPGPPACVLALNKTVSGAISFSGTTDFNAVGCTVHSNSTSPQDLSVSGNAAVVVGGFCSAGGVSSTIALTPEPRKNCPQLIDPFRNLPAAVTTGCTYANSVQIQPNEQQTLSPGIYCNGLSIKGGANLQA